MAGDERILNIVDEEGNVVGEATREEIHKKGLLHKEVHVWFYTPKGEIIFQRRAKDKDTNPNLLTATASGHVEIGESYIETAIKEVEEETGLDLKEINLVFLGMARSSNYDPITKTTNNRLAAEYAFSYKDSVRDLKVEPGKAQGFELRAFENFFNANESQKKEFVRTIFKPPFDDILHKIEILWKNKGK